MLSTGLEREAIRDACTHYTCRLCDSRMYNVIMQLFDLATTLGARVTKRLYIRMYVCTVSYGCSGPQNHICSFLWPAAAPHLLITCSILASGCVRFFIAIRLATNHCRPVMPFSSHIPVKISPILIADAMQNGVSYPKVGEKWPDVRSTVLSCELYPAGVLNCQEVLPV